MLLNSTVTCDNVQKSTSGAYGKRPHAVKDKLLFQLYRLKFSNNEVVRKRLFDELQGYSSKLEKLLDSSDEDAQVMRRRTEAGHLVATDSAICSFWVQARNLFRALAVAFKCRCQQHHAKLLLQHRTSKVPEFEVIFTELTSSRWELHRTRISQGDEAMAALMKESITLLETTNMPSQSSHQINLPARSAHITRNEGATTTVCVQQLRPPPSVTLTTTRASSHLSVTQEISNLCASLKRPEASCCGYLGEDYCRYYVYTISHQTADTIPSMTLDQILRGAIVPPPSRSQRYALSLIMASSFLQLAESPWLPSTALNKADVHFLSDPENPNIFLLDQPHITRDFVVARLDTTPAANVSGTDGGSSTTCTLSDALDHLGIMLLELCFGGILEDQACRKRWPAGANEREKAVFDIMAARDWQRQVNEEAAFDYADAIAWCLGGNRSAPSNRWRQDMLRKVVQPLQRCRDYLVHGGGVL